jgi:LAS superfamily LD-carboxypeptidase LdcB
MNFSPRIKSWNKTYFAQNDGLGGFEGAGDMNRIARLIAREVPAKFEERDVVAAIVKFINNRDSYTQLTSGDFAILENPNNAEVLYNQVKALTGGNNSTKKSPENDGQISREEIEKERKELENQTKNSQNQPPEKSPDSKSSQNNPEQNDLESADNSKNNVNSESQSAPNSEDPQGGQTAIEDKKLVPNSKLNDIKHHEDAEMNGGEDKKISNGTSKNIDPSEGSTESQVQNQPIENSPIQPSFENDDVTGRGNNERSAIGSENLNSNPNAQSNQLPNQLSPESNQPAQTESQESSVANSDQPPGKSSPIQGNQSLNERENNLGSAALPNSNSEPKTDLTSNSSKNNSSDDTNLQKPLQTTPKSEDGLKTENSKPTIEQNSSDAYNKKAQKLEDMVRSREQKGDLADFDRKLDGKTGQRPKALSEAKLNVRQSELALDQRKKALQPDKLPKLTGAAPQQSIREKAVQKGLEMGARAAATVGQAVVAVANAILGALLPFLPYIIAFLAIITVVLAIFASLAVYAYCKPEKPLRAIFEGAQGYYLSAAQDAAESIPLIGGGFAATTGLIREKSPLYQYFEESGICKVVNPDYCGGSGGGANISGAYGSAKGLVTTEECAKLREYQKFIDEASSMYGIPRDFIGAILSRETRVGTIIGGCSGYGDNGFGHGLGQIDPSSGYLPGPNTPVGTPTTVKDKNGKTLIWSDCRDGIVFIGFYFDRSVRDYGSELEQKGVKKGSYEYWRQIANTYNAGKICSIGTDSCTTGNDYGTDVMNRAADVKNCLENKGAPDLPSNSNTASVDKWLYDTIYNIKYGNINPLTFGSVQANAQNADEKATRDRVAGYYESGKVYQLAPAVRDIDAIKSGQADFNLVKYLDALYNSGIVWVSGPLNFGRSYGSHGTGRAMDIWGLGYRNEIQDKIKGFTWDGVMTGPRGTGTVPSDKGNEADSRIFRHVDIESPNSTIASKVGTLFKQAVDIGYSSGLVDNKTNSTHQVFANNSFSKKYSTQSQPIYDESVAPYHHHHLHIAFLAASEKQGNFSNSGVSGGGTSSSGDCAEVCVETTTANNLDSKNKLGVSLIKNVSSLVGFLRNMFIGIDTHAAYGQRPQSYADDIKNVPGYIDFLREVANEKGFPEYPDKGQVDSEAKQKIDEMVTQANSEGSYLKVNNIYRSYQEQVGLYFNPSSSVTNPISKYWSTNLTSEEKEEVKRQYKARMAASAPPGFSEHSSGLAVDFESSSGNLLEANDPGFAWLEKNASKYGFTLSYPTKNPSKGADYEPWHWGYKSKLSSAQVNGGANSGGAGSQQNCEPSGGGSSQGDPSPDAKYFPIGSFYEGPGPQQSYGACRQGGSCPHVGLDLTPPGSISDSEALQLDIYAYRAGKVIESASDFGIVTIEHNDGTKARYLHNSRRLVKTGDTVRAGQSIAKMGGAGAGGSNVYPIHLHFEFYDKNGSTINPSNILIGENKQPNPALKKNGSPQSVGPGI